jgi:multiple sugar transport system permease protein/putative aldouronate transport system permease protein
MANPMAMRFLGIATSVLPLAFAVFLNEKWFKNIVQTLTTLPNFISWVLVYMIAFAPFSSSGLVNDMLIDAGLITVSLRILDSDSHVWLMMLCRNTWKGLGWGAILYLAAISGIDPELCEPVRCGTRTSSLWLMRSINSQSG